MDDQIIIGAYHEAGHAIAAYFVGWSVHSIELNIKDEKLQYGKTIYNYGDDVVLNENIIPLRVVTLLGGPVSQKIFEKDLKIDLDNLGHDGKLLDKILESYSIQKKEALIQSKIKDLAFIFTSSPFNAVIEKLANQLIEVNYIEEPKFLEIVDELKSMRIN